MFLSDEGFYRRHIGDPKAPTACFDRAKDIVIPPWKVRTYSPRSRGDIRPRCTPMANAQVPSFWVKAFWKGGAPSIGPRRGLVFFAGDLGHGCRSSPALGPAYRPDIGPISAAGVSLATLMTSASERTRFTATPPSPSVAIARLLRTTPRATASADPTYRSTALSTAPASRSRRTRPTTTPTYRAIRTASHSPATGGRRGCLTRSCMGASPWSSRRAPA